MSSPGATPNSLQQRPIAPLPLRPRSRGRSSGNPTSSQSMPSSHEALPPNSLGETNLPLLTPSGCSDYLPRDHTLDGAANSYRSSPSGSSVPRTDFQLDQPGSNSHPIDEQPSLVFPLFQSSTCNASQEPDQRPASSSQGFTFQFDSTPAQIRFKFNPELPQPLLTMYSDEKITVPDDSGPHDRVVPTIVEDHSMPNTPLRRANISILPQDSDLSPNLGGLRQRSVSETSSRSDISDDPDPYDVTDEAAPLEPFFSSAFQVALQSGLDVANSVANIIESLAGSEGLSTDLQRLANDARSLGDFQSSANKIIGVLGNSGEGKSSLINSLLHFPEIAKTGDIGAACTSVVTEYRYKTRDHASPITIEAEYLSRSEIEDLIKELLWNYRQIFLPIVQSAETRAEDYSRYERESEQAWSALQAAFKHQPGFNKGLLTDMTEDGLSKATNQLIQWADEIQWPASEKPGVWKATAKTAEECCEMTSVFMEDKFWPFTKIIRVYLDAQVLKNGVVLADLPGLQDTNLARVRATQVYLMKCDNVFLITNISRAITDQSLQSSLYSLLARLAPIEWEESPGKSFNFAVVCTRSEGINQKAARREFCGPYKQISRSLMEELDEDIERAKREKNKVLRMELIQRQKLLLINARKNHVKEGLRKAYASKIPGGQLEVFCISNTDYERFAEKGNTEMVLASGIPELRQFCVKITAAAQLLEAKHFLQSRLSSLLGSVELWASSPSDLQVESPAVDDLLIHEMVREVKLEISAAIEQSRTEFGDTFRENISEFLEQRKEEWEKAAQVKGLEWFAWPWPQYNAWCINNGDHRTKGRSHHNWNSDLIWKMRAELALQWTIIEEEIPVLFEKCLRSVCDSLSNLQGCLQEQGLASTLVEGINFRVRSIKYRFLLAQQDFTREIKLINRYASEANESSYIVSGMSPAYRTAAAQAGDGKAARQKAIVQGRITDGTLFSQISVEIQDSVDLEYMTAFLRLQDIADTVFEGIVNDINMALARLPPRISNARRDENLERQKELLSTEIKELKEEHAALLARISNIG